MQTNNQTNARSKSSQRTAYGAKGAAGEQTENRRNSCREEKTQDKKKGPDIKKINVQEPTDFRYDLLVGSGAFGKVRKCLYHKTGSNGSTDSTDESGEKSKNEKQTL